ncbi:thioredoxin [Candidatus Pacearchaeota archaeon]|nr:thioredoxin [Candidatus Pacearchaeota archaeon]
MGDVPHFSQKEFEAKTAKGNWIIDFWAEWCGPCKIIGPEVEAAAKKLAGKVSVGKVNVDEEQDLAQQYEVMSIPTLLFIKNGQVVDRTVGALESDEIIEKAEEVF